MDPSGDISCDASSRHVVYVRSRVRARMLVEGLRWVGQQLRLHPMQALASVWVFALFCLFLFWPIASLVWLAFAAMADVTHPL